MSKIFATGLYKLSITLLVFSCLGFVFNIVSLASSTHGNNIFSFFVSVVQIVVCALGIHGAKTYNFTTLLVGAIGCGIVVALDATLVIIFAIFVAAAVAVGAGGGGVAGAAMTLWVGILLLILPLIFFILYIIEFALLIKHTRIANGSHPSEYVKV